MISINGLYATLREAIVILTNVEIYQNKRSSPKIVDAKWLFVKVVYYLFNQENILLIDIAKPNYDTLAFQLGYSTRDGIKRLKNNYIPKDKDIEWKLELLKYVFTGYINNDLDKVYVVPFIVQSKYERWLINTIKIKEDDKTI